MGHSLLPQHATLQDIGNAGQDWEVAVRQGNWAAAWRVSDAVLRARDPRTRDDPAQPYHKRWVWDGQPFAGQDVVVRCYHGLGDTLQFCRFLPLLRARVRSLTLEVQPELLGLLADLPGPDRLHPFDPARPLPSSCDLEIMELAHALRVPPETASYLSVLPWNGKDQTSCLDIGLCWAAGGWDPGRSLPLAMLTPLRALPGIRAVSLQRGPAAAEWPGGDASMDVRHTAQIIAGLDLVVTVDTMVAHLAGALGRPAYVLLQHHADWRWADEDRSPWYPTLRLHRQDVQGNWHAPVARLLADVAARLLPGNLVPP